MKELMIVVTAIGLALAFILLAALPFMWLWNWLMPELFGLKIINFWQSLGLLALSSFLFKSTSSSTGTSSSQTQETSKR